MSFRWIAFPALLVLGCSNPSTQASNYAGREGWPPTVNVIQPAQAQPGTMVKLMGAYLDDATQVLIGGKPANFTVAGRVLQATVPQDLGPGEVRVVVVVPKGTTAPTTLNVVP